MKKTKYILIIGGSGVVGTSLALFLKKFYRVAVTYDQHPIRIPGVSAFPLSLLQRDWIKRLLYAVQPDVIIYAAGKSDPTWVSKHVKEAEIVHAGGAAAVALAADILQPKFIYISSAHVFDGGSGNYEEDHVVLPYLDIGKVKLSGENYIRGKSLNYVIVRCSPILTRGNGISMSFLDQLRLAVSLNTPIELDVAEVHSFLPIETLQSFIHLAIQTDIRNKIFHLGGLTKLTAYEYGKMFCQYFGFPEKIIVGKGGLTPQAVSPEVKADFSLDSSLAVQSLKLKPFLLEEGFDLLKKKLFFGL